MATCWIWKSTLFRNFPIWKHFLDHFQILILYKVIPDIKYFSMGASSEGFFVYSRVESQPMELRRDFVMETSKFDDLFEQILMKNTKIFDVLGISPAAMVWMTLQSKLRNSGLHVLDGFVKNLFYRSDATSNSFEFHSAAALMSSPAFKWIFVTQFPSRLRKALSRIIEFLPWQLHIYAVFNSVSWINWDFILWNARKSNWQQTKNFQLITL